MQQAIDILKAMKRKAEIKRWTWCWYMIETIDEAIHKIEALWDGWIPVTERLPEHWIEVLAFYTNEYWKWRRLKAQYLYKWKEESDWDSSWEPYDEYIEEEDKYTYIEWWYECNEIEDWQYYISEKITHWMPLPNSPKQ